MARYKKILIGSCFFLIGCAGGNKVTLSFFEDDEGYLDSTNTVKTVIQTDPFVYNEQELLTHSDSIFRTYINVLEADTILRTTFVTNDINTERQYDSLFYQNMIRAYETVNDSVIEPSAYTTNTASVVGRQIVYTDSNLVFEKTIHLSAEDSLIEQNGLATSHLEEQIDTCQLVAIDQDTLLTDIHLTSKENNTEKITTIDSLRWMVEQLTETDRIELNNLSKDSIRNGREVAENRIDDPPIIEEHLVRPAFSHLDTIHHVNWFRHNPIDTASSGLTPSEQITYNFHYYYYPENKPVSDSLTALNNYTDNSHIYTARIDSLTKSVNYLMELQRNSPLRIMSTVRDTIAVRDTITLRDTIYENDNHTDFIVYFDLGSTHVSFDPGQRESIQSLLKNKEIQSIKLSSFTDNSGSETQNMTLSEKRSEQVKKALIALGSDEQLIFYQNFGERYATSSSQTERRIIISITWL